MEPKETFEMGTDGGHRHTQKDNVKRAVEG